MAPCCVFGLVGLTLVPCSPLATAFLPLVCFVGLLVYTVQTSELIGSDGHASSHIDQVRHFPGVDLAVNFLVVSIGIYVSETCLEKGNCLHVGLL